MSSIIMIVIYCMLNIILVSNIYSQWKPCTKGLDDGDVNELITDGFYIYAGQNRGGIFISDDYGDNWKSVNNGLKFVNNYFQTNAFTRISRIIFAGTIYGIYMSINFGEEWVPMNNGINSKNIESLTVREDNLFVGLADLGIYKSIDSGKNWKACNNGLTNKFILTLTVIDSSIFAGTFGGGIFITMDDGGYWTEINNGLTNKIVRAISKIGDKLYAGTEGGLFISNNNGLNWFFCGLMDRDVREILNYGNVIFAGTYDGGVFKSTNEGKDWSSINKGLAYPFVLSMLIKDNYIFAGASCGTLYKANINDFITGIDDYKLISQRIKNYPNPFQYTTNIEYTLPHDGNVLISIYDMQGQLVKELYSGSIDAGKNTSTWDGRTDAGNEAPTGVYFYKIQFGKQTIRGKMLIIR